MLKNTRSALNNFTFLSSLSEDFFLSLENELGHKRDALNPAWKRFFETLGEVGAPSSPQKLMFASQKDVSPREDAYSHVCDTLKEGARQYGYLDARLDPLALCPTSQTSKAWAEQILIQQGHDPKHLLPQIPDSFTDTLWSIYGGTSSLACAHVSSIEERAWLYYQFENERLSSSTDLQQLKRIFCWLLEAGIFEKFLARHFPGEKRFSIEGAESLRAGLEVFVAELAQQGVTHSVFGLTHRGRLCLMATLLAEPLAGLFARFEHQFLKDCRLMASDVKYHLGCDTERMWGRDKMRLTLLPNPSHLESVLPCVQGYVRGFQQRETSSKGQIAGIVLHGDASVCGQGVVAEAFNLSGLEAYSEGGLIHIIVDNQVGFTASEKEVCAGKYASSFLRGFDLPILYVNGDDPLEVVRVFQLAAAYRARFQKSIVIHYVCYRRFGHNENDSASFTNPRMAQAIADQLPVVQKFAQQLIADGVLSTSSVAAEEARLKERFDQAYKDYQKNGYRFSLPQQTSASLGATGVSEEMLKRVIHGRVTYPKDFSVHPKLKRFHEAFQRLGKEKDVDWAEAETLAIGSLLLEGIPVRLAGQDSVRGTFSQRHAALIDQKTEARYIPLNHLNAHQAMLEVLNTPLSEYAALGFELGYSWACPKSLIMWEAQYGDFANGAQVIIDQYISSCKSKWGRESALTLLLPHGYEGQGPEHSSARLERFLQLAAQKNMRIVQPTTPANYFHVLRRQALLKDKLPLVVMTPKSLLRHPRAVSPLSDFFPKTSFEPVLVSDKGKGTANRVILCTGRIYYDLLEAQDEQESTFPLVRMEQLYPFPEKALTYIMKRLKPKTLVWAQDEPENMGGWAYMRLALPPFLKTWGVGDISYAGRLPAASPATGFFGCHKTEEKSIIRQAFGDI
jgi:2-oxoglutarate dehydrogenase E1 component